MWSSPKADSILDADTLLLRFCTLVHDARDMAAVIAEIAGDAELADICRLLHALPDKRGVATGHAREYNEKRIEHHFLTFCKDQMLNPGRIQRRVGQIVQALHLDTAPPKPADGRTMMGIPDAMDRKPRAATTNRFPKSWPQEYRSLFWIMGSLLVVLMVTMLVFEKTLLSGTFENATPHKVSAPQPDQPPFSAPLIANGTFHAAARSAPETGDIFKPAAPTPPEPVAGYHPDPDEAVSAPPPPAPEPMAEIPAISPPPSENAAEPAEAEVENAPPPAKPATAPAPRAPSPQATLSAHPAEPAPQAATATAASTTARNAGPPRKEKTSPAPTSPEPVLQQRLELFLEAYCAAYSSRDLERFVTFFAPAATEQGRSFQTVLPDYRETFGRVKTMDYAIHMLSFTAEPTGATHIKGRFQARYELAQGERGSSSGLIDMTISEQAGNFLITTLNYTLD
jgi:hypothetical protein